jgi:hypothetical protein
LVDRSPGLLLEQRLRLDRELVEERGGPVDDPRGLHLGQLVAHLGSRDSLGQVVRRCVAGEAALEQQQALEVRTEGELLEVPADQHHDRVVAELLLELLRRTVRLRPLVDQRVRLAVGLQGACPDDADDRQQHRQRDHGRGPLDAPGADPCESAPHP